MSGAAPTYQLGPFRLDPLTQVLWRGEDVVPLTPRALDLLTALVEKRGDVATKAELMAKVWPDVVVGEANLSVTMSALRRALGRTPDGGEYVQTVPRRGYRFVGPLSGMADERPALAVLPFRVLGSAPEDEPLGLGMADAVIARLAGVEELVTRPLGAVARFAASAASPQQVARELGVDAVLEGSVQRHAGRVRASVHLVPARPGLQAWAETFEQPVAGLFELQDAVAEGVAAAVVPRLKGSHVIRSPRRQPALEAYEAYLRGRLNWSRFDAQGIGKALGCFAEAVQKDPGFAQPHAGLADAHLVMGFAGVVPQAGAWETARACAEAALERDAELSPAHITLGFVALFGSWDWAGARRSFEKAVALRPRSAAARLWYGLFLGMAGELAAARREAAHARETDPLSPTANALGAFLHGFAGEHERQLELARRAVEIDPGHILAQWSLGEACLLNRLRDGAVAAMDRALALAGGGPVLKASRAAVLSALGRRDEGRRVLAELDAAAAQSWVSPYQRAVLATALGRKASALARLEEAFRLRDPWLVFLAVDPALASLRGSGTLEALLARFHPRGRG